MIDLLNNPFAVLLAAAFVTVLVFVSIRKEQIPSFIFLLFAALGAFFVLANIRGITFLKAFILFFFIVIMFSAHFFRRQKIPALNIILVLLFVSAVTISSFLNNTPFESTRSYLGTMIIALVVALSPTKEKTLKYLTVSIAFWGLVNLVAALFQWSGHGMMYKSDPIHTGFRIEGLMGTSTMMGIYFVLALNAVQALYFYAKKKIWKVALFALGAGLIVGLLGTLSRAALVAWIVSFLFLQYKLYGMKVSSVVGIAIFTLVAFGLASMLNLDEIMTARFTVIKKDPSAQNRIPLIQAALKYLAEKPFFGVGLSQGGLGARNVLVNTHNTFIQRLMENGIIGFLIFLAMIWRSTQGLFSKVHFQSPDATHGYRIGFLAMIIGVFTMGLFHDFSYLMPLWLILGLGLMPWRSIKSG
jgi:O-antigen ligase